jgi:hypothetical protein
LIVSENMNWVFLILFRRGGSHAKKIGYHSPHHIVFGAIAEVLGVTIQKS